VNKQNALILNFTANTYHWGCYGTSLEIYTTLLERGYFVNWLDVRSSHALAPSPATGADFNDGAFAKRFFEANKPVYHQLTEADVIVVNGEGTLHRLRSGPLNLLYLMYAAQCFLKKPVHLINHSFFPSGSTQPDDRVDALYRAVGSTLTRIVPRETASAAVLARLGIPAVQGFDCLPRFLARHGITAQGKPGAPLVLSGGISLSDEQAAQIANAAASCAAAGQEMHFLTGAKNFPAPEDDQTFAAMRKVIPALRRIHAATMSEWAASIASAACVVSARFHHTIAAAAVGTPVVVFPSNTPKVHAICEMFGLPAPIELGAPDFAELARTRIQAALQGGNAVASKARRAEILALAENNFAGL
jgi:polysaccharide pyruvyl transferase WcaK-like protein